MSVVERCQPFVILFQGRSGSTYLASLLNSHPDIFCRFEDFDTEGPDQATRRLLDFSDQYIEGPTYEQIQAHLCGLLNRNTKASGFKFKYPFQYARYPEVLFWMLQQKDNLKVIHLDRSNILKRVVSLEHLSVLRNKGHVINANLVKRGGHEKFVLNIPRLINLVLMEEHTQSVLEFIVSQFPNRLTVEYDDLLKSRDECLYRITDFLGVERFSDIRSEFHKATPDDLQEVVENYDQLQRALADTPYSIYLENRPAA